MILFTVNGLDLRAFDTGREIATKTLSPAEAARLTSDLLDGLHDHLTTGALRGPQEGHLAAPHPPCVNGAERPLAPAHIERKDQP